MVDQAAPSLQDAELDPLGTGLLRLRQGQGQDAVLEPGTCPVRVDRRAHAHRTLERAGATLSQEPAVAILLLDSAFAPDRQGIAEDCGLHVFRLDARQGCPDLEIVLRL